MTRPPDFEMWRPGLTPAQERALWYRNMAAMERWERARPKDPARSRAASARAAKRREGA